MCAKVISVTSRSIQVDSGSEVSSSLASIGADTYPLHETRLSMCGGHHVSAGGGKLHELGARILGLEAGDVRGDCCELVGSIQGHGHWQSTSVDTGSWPLWLGDDLVRKASGTRITLFKRTVSGTS